MTLTSTGSGESFPPKEPLAGNLAREVAPEATLAVQVPSGTAELLETCRQWVRRFIIVTDEQATIMAAWTLHTYVFSAGEFTPYIHITAPEKACGKSRLMEALEAIAASPVRSGGMTAAALVRCIDTKTPTIFLDEMDAQLGGNKEYAETIRGILNDGFRKGGKFYKCVGKNHDFKEFNTYCPKCFAGIGDLPDTVSSRSIIISMRRKLPGESVQPFRQRAIKIEALPIRKGLEQWAAGDRTETLQSIRPLPIESLNDRQNDIAEPLLAIAQFAGGSWLKQLTSALQIVFRADGNEDGSSSANLLADIRATFDERKAERLSSKELAACLCEFEGRPWADWNHGKGISPSNLARQLRKFKIYPGTIRFTDETAKGYRRGDFEEAWSRYCASSPLPTVTTSQPASLLNETAFSNRNTHPLVTVAKSASNPHEQRGVTGVTVENRNTAYSGVRMDPEALPDALPETGKLKEFTV